MASSCERQNGPEGEAAAEALAKQSSGSLPRPAPSLSSAEESNPSPASEFCASSCAAGAGQSAGCATRGEGAAWCMSIGVCAMRVKTDSETLGLFRLQVERGERPVTGRGSPVVFLFECRSTHA